MASGRKKRLRAAGGVAAYPRVLRVNEVLRQIVAEELERLADADERLRLVTVTSVDTSPDLRQATVYLGSLDDDVAEALDERRVQLQRAVGGQVRMKRTPRLGFAADPAVSAGERVEEVLRRLGGRAGRPEDPAGDRDGGACPPSGTLPGPADPA
jgi:ribosome-binding factor A